MSRVTSRFDAGQTENNRNSRRNQGPMAGRALLGATTWVEGRAMTRLSKGSPEASDRVGEEPARSPSSGALPPLPESWRGPLAGEIAKPYFHEIERFVAEERRAHLVFPARDDVFNA